MLKLKPKPDPYEEPSPLILNTTPGSTPYRTPAPSPPPHAPLCALTRKFMQHPVFIQGFEDIIFEASQLVYINKQYLHPSKKTIYTEELIKHSELDDLNQKFIQSIKTLSIRRAT